MRRVDWHFGDYITATAHLSDDEDLAYRRLIELYYLDEKPIETDVGSASRRVRFRTDAKVEAVRAVLNEFFELRDDGWHNKRCDEEIEAYRSRVVNARINGKKGGRKPRTNVGTKSVPTPLAERTNNQANHPPSTIHHPPSTIHSLKPCDGVPVAAKGAAETRNAPSAATWTAYCNAFRERYGTTPVRNARVNGQLAQLIGRVGATDAPDVVRFYLRHNNAAYVKATHSVGALLRDCEGLCAQMRRGRPTTSTEAMQADRTQTNANAFAPLLAEAKEREEASRAEH